MVLKRILRCFELTSGLGINLSKGVTVGVGVSQREIQALAAKLHYKFGKLPLLCLRLPDTGKVKSRDVWNLVVGIFKRKLPMWKKEPPLFWRKNHLNQSLSFKPSGILYVLVVNACGG